MNVAFLFNCNDPEYGGYYGGPIRDKILATGVLQKTGRHMRVCIGDVLTYGRCKTISQLRSVYRPHSWDKRKRNSLEASIIKQRFFAVVSEYKKECRRAVRSCATQGTVLLRSVGY